MSKKTTRKTAPVSIDRVCKTCALYEPASGYCKKKNEQTPGIRYACEDFRTLQELKEERERRKQERLKKEEQRLNFILTALYISTTASQQLLEYFDAQFADRKAEAEWRFERKRAANEIGKLAQRIRDIYQHSFMQDQNQVMTKHGTAPYDVEAYDSHEDDARRWNLCLFHHMDGCWQDEGMEQMVLNFYEELPHLGIFDQRDYRHFTTKQ
jgi:hypothetical protein